MGNTELRRVNSIVSLNTYYVSKEGILYRQLRNKPRERQLASPTCKMIQYRNFWLNPIGGYKDTKGYLRVDIDDTTQAIHRLVALEFIDNPDKKSQINHKDGIKTNNHVDNLEWVTGQENIEHAFKILDRKPSYGKKGKFGERNPIKIERNNLIQELIETSDKSYKEIAAITNVTLGIVKSVAQSRKVQRLSSNGVGNSISEAPNS